MMSQTFEFDLVTAFNASSLNISEKDFKAANPNEFYLGGDLAWMMMSSGLVLLMVPGLGLFYSGISERCSAVSMMWMSMLTTALIGVQWFLWGYSVTFTGPVNLWGSSDSFALHNDLTIPWGNKPGTKIPQLLYAFYQGMFACFTAAVVSGAVIRKGRPLHFLVFIFIWSTFVYDFVARSSWNPVGWSNYWKGQTSGVFDFAGGTVVHIVSATTSAVYSIFCKWRRPIFGLPALQKADKDNLNRPSAPHNVVNVVLGTAFLWIGWFGFNGGSALGANLRAVSACISTHLAACAGGVTGTLLEYVAASRRDADVGRFSVIGFCNGAVAGLVAITPAAGYVPYWSAPIFGIAGSFFVSVFQDISETYFDTNQIFVVHGVAGWVGMLLTAAFARADIAALDGYTVIINHKWEQLGIQVSDALVGMCWSGIVSFLILLVMELVIQGYRKARGIQEPVFQLVLDRDILLDHEISDEFWRKDGSNSGSAEIGGRGGRRGMSLPVGEGIELGAMIGNGRRGGEEQAVGELDGREGSLRGSGGDENVSLESRDEN